MREQNEQVKAGTKTLLEQLTCTVEQLEEMDAARARGEISALERSLPSLTDLAARSGKYGWMAREELRTKNPRKHVRLLIDFTLWDELNAVAERARAMKAQMWEAYRSPETTDYLERVTHMRMYEREIEERIYREIIEPFAQES